MSKCKKLYIVIQVRVRGGKGKGGNVEGVKKLVNKAVRSVFSLLPAYCASSILPYSPIVAKPLTTNTKTHKENRVVIKDRQETKV